MLRSQVAESALSYIGTPWVHQGRTKGVGVDCIGLLVGVASEVGLNFEDQTDYSPVPHDAKSHLIEGLQHNNCSRTQECLPGNILLFCLMKAKMPSHCAILVGNGRMIHAMNYRSKSGKLHQVRAHVYANPWVSRTHSIWAYPGIED